MIKEKMKQLIGKSINKYNTQHVKDVVSELKFKEQYQGRIIDCMIGEVDDNYIETPETNEPIVKLEHSKEGIVKIPSIKGKTILVDSEGNETDTPGEGCKLVSVGESEDNRLLISSKNKNLFDENELKQEPISTDFSYINQDNKRCIKNNVKGWRYLKILNNKFKENTIYRITYCAKNTDVTNNGTGAYFMLEYTDGTTSPLYTNNLNGQWFEVSGYSVQGKTIKCVNFSNAGNCITYIDLDSIIITEGTEKVEYIPSKQHKTEILLNEPLRSLPNGVCDEIIDNKLIRRIGKIVLDGENVTSIGIINDNIVDVLYFDRIVTNKKFINYSSEGQQLIKSNIYRTGINANNWNSTTSENTLVNTNSGGFWIFLPKFTVLNIEDARNYMNNKPTEVLYELEEPIIEELPNGITLQGFDDTTMYIENEITPTVQYGYNALIPYKEEVLNQQQEVETNTLDIEQNIIPYLMDMEFNLMLMEDE